MNDNLKALIHYRLEQAEESISSAKLLLENEKYRPIVSRAYYAMFYAVLALLVKEKLKVSKHSGVIGTFNRVFVKKGIFDKALSRWLQEAFDLRQRADYREMFTVSFERADSILKNAEIFVTKVKGHFEDI